MRIYALIFDSMLIFKFQKVFLPLVIFRNAEREGTGYYCFEVPYLNFFWCNFNYSFGSDLLLLVITLEYILTIFSILTTYWQTDRQIDFDNLEFYFCFKTCIDNQYALHWTPNVASTTPTRRRCLSHFQNGRNCDLTMGPPSYACLKTNAEEFEWKLCRGLEVK